MFYNPLDGEGFVRIMGTLYKVRITHSVAHYQFGILRQTDVVNGSFSVIEVVKETEITSTTQNGRRVLRTEV